MNGNANFLFFCMIFVGKSALGQQNTGKLLKINDLYTTNPDFKKIENPGLNIFNYKFNKTHTAAATINKPSALVTPVAYSIVSPSYYTQNFGFFCKQELQLEKLTKIPFKFRLGSVQQCDWMEGKPNTVIR
jgi:hypothetical protein